MQITSQIDGPVTVLTIAGRIDSRTMTSLEQAAATVVDGGGSRVVLDMGAVDYVSSAGLRAILIAAKKAKAAGGGLALFGVQPGVSEVFETSGFGDVVPIVPTHADARRILTA